MARSSLDLAAEAFQQGNPKLGVKLSMECAALSKEMAPFSNLCNCFCLKKQPSYERAVLAWVHSGRTGSVKDRRSKGSHSQNCLSGSDQSQPPGRNNGRLSGCSKSELSITLRNRIGMGFPRLSLVLVGENMWGMVSTGSGGSSLVSSFVPSRDLSDLVFQIGRGNIDDAPLANLPPVQGLQQLKAHCIVDTVTAPEVHVKIGKSILPELLLI